MKGAKQLRNMIYNILENSDTVSGVTLKNSPNSSTLLFAIPVLGIRGYLYGILCSELALSILHSLQILQNNYSNPRK